MGGGDRPFPLTHHQARPSPQCALPQRGEGTTTIAVADATTLIAIGRLAENWKLGACALCIARILHAAQESTPGAAEMGSCLTDATRARRARRTVRGDAAPSRAERTTSTSTRPVDPVEAFRPPRQNTRMKSAPMRRGVKRGAITSSPRNITRRAATRFAPKNAPRSRAPACGLRCRARSAAMCRLETRRPRSS